MRFHASLAGSLLATLGFAQTTFVLPSNYATTEGPTNSASWMPIFGSSGQGRYQWTSGAVRGAPIANISKVEYRRDGTQAANTAYGPRTTTLTFLMGHCNASALTTTFANNYIGTPTTCVSAMPYSFPDHTNPPATPPAPWTVSIPFTNNFSYNGTDDLLWEMSCTGTTPTGSYSIDGAAGTTTGTVGTSVYVGSPCSGTGIIKVGPTLVPPSRARIAQYALNVPASQPGILIFGATDPNTTLGGQLCQALHASLDITLGVMSDATGNIASSTTPISFDVNAPAAPVSIYSQFAVYNPTSTFAIPVHMTDGIQWNLTPVVLPNLQSLLYSDASATAATGSRSTSSMAIARFTRQ